MSEKAFELLKEAKRQLKLADHLVNVTYKVVNDEKLLINALRKVRDALRIVVEMFFALEEQRGRRFPALSKATIEKKISFFKLNIAPKYQIERTYLRLITIVEEIIHTYENTPFEIIKNNQLYLPSQDTSSIKVIDVRDVKKYINITKEFLWKCEIILKENGKSLHPR